MLTNIDEGQRQFSGAILFIKKIVTLACLLEKPYNGLKNEHGAWYSFFIIFFFFSL